MALHARAQQVRASMSSPLPFRARLRALRFCSHTRHVCCIAVLRLSDDVVSLLLDDSGTAGHASVQTSSIVFSESGLCVMLLTAHRVTAFYVCRDKDTPNALTTYHKVMLSIFSAIDEAEIAEQFEMSYEIGHKVYARDIAQRTAEAKAAARPHSRAPPH